MKEANKSPSPSGVPPATVKSGADRGVNFYAHRHLRFGWWALLVFLSLGMVLEVFHGFKVGWYLDTSNETRRLMWTLGHAHGTLLAVVNLAFGVTVAMLPRLKARLRPWVSGCLLAATVLIPGGFFLGGAVIHAGDPGVGIVLLPLGAVFLLAGIFLIARGAGGPPSSSETDKRPGSGR